MLKWLILIVGAAVLLFLPGDWKIGGGLGVLGFFALREMEKEGRI